MGLFGCNFQAVAAADIHVRSHTPSSGAMMVRNIATADTLLASTSVLHATRLRHSLGRSPRFQFQRGHEPGSSHAKR